MTFDHPPRVGHLVAVGGMGGLVGYLSIHAPGPAPKLSAVRRARIIGAACLVGAVATEIAGVKVAGSVLAGLGGMFTVAGQAQLFRTLRGEGPDRPSLYTSPGDHPAITPGIAG